MLKHQCSLVIYAVLVHFLYRGDAATNDTLLPLALYPVGDIRNCPVVSPITGKPLYRMEVLPGLGFDNLRNYDMNQVVQYNYSLCKTTNDGRFLIPDDMITIPIQKSSLETYSEVINHWDDYKSSTSFSINVEASALFSLISGKFSTEYQHNKEHQVNDHSVTTRVQVRSLLYNVLLESDSALHPKFKNRLLDIAANIQDNQTEYAAYLSELLVRDYGTHIVRRAEAGGLMSQTDSIFYEFISDHTSNYFGISASASVNFLIAKLKMSASFSHLTSHDSYYEDNRHHSLIQTIGGPAYKDGMTLNQWEAGLLNALAAIDRAGDPLHWAITTRNMPELPTPLLNQVTDSVHKAIKRYYTINTIHGCTDPEAPNFEYEANLDDGSCHKSHANYSFGGVYQTCKANKNQYRNLCDESNDEIAAAATPNPLTGDYSCPNGFRAIELHSGTVSHEDKVPHFEQHCHSFAWGLSSHCTTSRIVEHFISVAQYQTYWCVADGKVPDDTGYMFGGAYTEDTVNPNTGSMTCPSHYLPLRIGREVKVCVSDEYQFGGPYSMPFGGFFSCTARNPLSTTSGRSTGVLQCPKSFKPMVASVEDGCEISYCTKLKVKYTSKPPIPPPFHSKPKAKANASQAMVIVGSYGETWVRDAEGGWHKYNETKLRITGEDVLRNLAASFNPSPSPAANESTPLISPSVIAFTDNTKPQGMSATVSAAISSAVTLVVCALTILAVFGIYGIAKRNKKGSGNTYASLEDEGNTTSKAMNSTTPVNSVDLT